MVVLDGGECVEPEWGGRKGEVGGELVCVYAAAGKGPEGGIAGMSSGGLAVCGVRALDHSSSENRDEDVTAAAALGDPYNVDGLNDGGRGRGACRRGSGA
jgi:hypothetical protein